MVFSKNGCTWFRDMAILFNSQFSDLPDLWVETCKNNNFSNTFLLGLPFFAYNAYFSKIYRKQKKNRKSVSFSKQQRSRYSFLGQKYFETQVFKKKKERKFFFCLPVLRPGWMADFCSRYHSSCVVFEPL